ncbi:hypothetical protein U9M48_009479 [Paspalum notatum var. saurae]|uniref:Uncharacterized protein n=1 Tax=Paspalum notatum var. saurae TaxID=547442 RepID=A0AAQ3WF35_PASNO
MYSNRGIKQFDLNVIHFNVNGLITSRFNTVRSLYFIFEYMEHDLNDITSSLRLSLLQGQFAKGLASFLKHSSLVGVAGSSLPPVRRRFVPCSQAAGSSIVGALLAGSPPAAVRRTSTSRRLARWSIRRRLVRLPARPPSASPACRLARRRPRPPAWVVAVGRSPARSAAVGRPPAPPPPAVDPPPLAADPPPPAADSPPPAADCPALRLGLSTSSSRFVV